MLFYRKCVDGRAKTVFTFCGADGEVVDSTDTTFITYLENFRNKLCSNRYEFLDDCGLVERVGQSSSPKGKKAPAAADQAFSGK